MILFTLFGLLISFELVTAWLRSKQAPYVVPLYDDKKKDGTAIIVLTGDVLPLKVTKCLKRFGDLAVVQHNNRYKGVSKAVRRYLRKEYHYRRVILIASGPAGGHLAARFIGHNKKQESPVTVAGVILSGAPMTLNDLKRRPHGLLQIIVRFWPIGVITGAIKPFAAWIQPLRLLMTRREVKANSFADIPLVFLEPARDRKVRDSALRKWLAAFGTTLNEEADLAPYVQVLSRDPWKWPAEWAKGYETVLTDRMSLTSH